MFLLDEILIKSRLRLLEEVEWFPCFPASPIVDPRQEYARLHRHCLLFFVHPDFFPQPIRAMEGFSTRVSQTSVWPADGSISIQRNPRHQQLLHKEKGNQGKSVGTAFPEGSVCPWPGILLQLSMSETSCQSVHDLLLFPSLMNPRWV